ncbi:uncharacterized protein DUF2183 [Permianibacter aggregans]|uniref:Uncharacterized protein DUF2183 n=2 Tax=Permianibacter aggregans TaxID=1510150 RepID=A0A4R6UKA5_9GAMM|nr:uncharacterized protein DUF2183 [Permianibacter aggregans]
MNQPPKPWAVAMALFSLGTTSANSAEPVSFSLKVDETAVFFPTDASFDEKAGQWQVPIHGWVYEVEQSVVRKHAAAEVLEQKFELLLTAESEPIFSERVDLLLADNERGKRLWIRLCGEKFALNESEPNGHTHTMLSISADVASVCADAGYLHYQLLLSPEDTQQVTGRVRLLSHNGFSLISDIDDTVKITEVTHRERLLDNTFYQPFRAVPGMPAAYQRLAQNGVQLHFVSSSPWQLYPVLEAFREHVNFPDASYSLKYLRFRDSDFFNLFKSGEETKPQQIEALLQRFSGRQFILVGDSGEQDPEVYAQMLRQYPEQVLGFAIRLIDDSDQEARFEALMRGLDEKKALWFRDPERLPLFFASLQREP